MTILLLDSVQSSEGRWVDTSAFTSMSIAIYGFGQGDAAQVWGSNCPEPPSLVPPSPGDGTMQIFNLPITGDTFIDTSGLPQPVHWLRVRKLAGSSPARTTAYLQALA